jgi:hypothetical protein
MNASSIRTHPCFSFHLTARALLHRFSLLRLTPTTKCIRKRQKVLCIMCTVIVSPQLQWSSPTIKCIGETHPGQQLIPTRSRTSRVGDGRRMRMVLNGRPQDGRWGSAAMDRADFLGGPGDHWGGRSPHRSLLLKSIGQATPPPPTNL